MKPHPYKPLRKPYPIHALKVGPLYKCTSHYLLAYLNFKEAQSLFPKKVGTALHYNVGDSFYVPRNEPFMIVKKSGRLAKVISGTNLGWVMLTDLKLEIEEMK